jgi:hypothetical protein
VLGLGTYSGHGTGRCHHTGGMTTSHPGADRWRWSLALVVAVQASTWRDVHFSPVVGMVEVWDLVTHRMPWLGGSLVLERAWWWPARGCSGG